MFVSMRNVAIMEGALTSRVCTAPKHDCSILVRWVAQDLMQLHREAVQVTNVQRAKVAMEGIVE